MNRRRFVGALAGGVLVTLRMARAQQAPKFPLIATLSAGSPSPAGGSFDAFLARMRELGYEDRRNVRIEMHYSGGDPQRLKELATEIVRRKADIILASSTPATYAASAPTASSVRCCFVGWLS